MFSFKLIFLIASKFVLRHKQTVILLILLVGFSFLIQLKYHLLSPEPAIRIGFIGTYQEHDLPLEMTQLVSQSLTKADKSGRIISNLSSGWETNNDATRFTFRIKQDLKWSDGTTINSSNLSFSIPNAEASFQDAQTVEFKLKEAYSTFPSLLASPLFKKDTLIGTGPYKITKIEKSRIFITKIILEPVNNSQPSLPKVVVRFYPNEKTALTGFMLGEVEALFGVNNNKLPKGENFKLTQITDYGKVVAIFFNTKDPLLSNRSLRQALSFAAPLIQNEVRAKGPYPDFSWASFPGLKEYLDKPEDARTALERAKTTTSNDAFEKAVVLTTTPQLEEIGKQVVAAWESLGLKATLRVESGRPQNFQALLITQSIPADPDQYFLWHSTQEQTNLTKYSPSCCPTSARVDKDLEDGRKGVKEEDRKASYLDFQKVLIEDSPAAYLYFPKYNVIYLNKAEENLNKILPLILSQN